MSLRLRIISPMGCVYMSPAGIEKLKLTGTPVDGRGEQKFVFTGDLIFTGRDYTYFYDLDRSIHREKPVLAQLQKNNGAGWEIKRDGYILMRDMVFQHDMCTCKGKLLLKGKYSNLDNALNKEYNLLKIALTKYSASHISITGNINNGVSLLEVLAAMLYDAAGISNIKSDFFQWNSDNPSYTKGNSSLLHNILLFQKSDVIRRNVVGISAATVMNITLGQLLKDLCTMFNLEYIIDANGAFRIEHITWWNKGTWLDLTQAKYAKYTIGTNNWKYANDNAYRYESWEMKDGVNPDFCKLLLEYRNAYTFNADIDTKEYKIEMYTDVVNLCGKDGTDNANDYDGIVMVACDSSGVIQADYNIISNPLLQTANNVLSPQLLFYNFHRDGRYFPDGTVTSMSVIPFSVNYTFSNISRSKLQDKITIKYCDNDSLISLFDRVKTSIGYGDIKSFEYCYADGTMIFELLHLTDYSYTPVVPVAVGDNYVTRINTVLNTVSASLSPLGANDSGFTNIFEETKPTYNGGTVVIKSNGHFIYTPPVNFFGQDYFDYACVNSNGFAATATATIGVKPNNIYAHAVTVAMSSGVIAVYYYYVKWYLDAALTQPLDVSGFNLSVSIALGPAPVIASGYSTYISQTTVTPIIPVINPNPDYTII